MRRPLLPRRRGPRDDRAVPDRSRPPQDDRSAIVLIVVALFAGGALTLTGVLTSSLDSTAAGVVVLFVCSTATRIWYLRRRR